MPVLALALYPKLLTFLERNSVCLQGQESGARNQGLVVQLLPVDGSVSFREKLTLWTCCSQP